MFLGTCELVSCESGQRLADEDDNRYQGVNNKSLAVSGTIVLSKEVLKDQKDAFVADHVNNSIVPLRCNKKMHPRLKYMQRLPLSLLLCGIFTELPKYSQTDDFLFKDLD